MLAYVARHLVLIGMMGSGKSTVGRLVAERLGRAFVDSDEQLRERLGRTAREIAERDGEEALRRAEADALTAALAGPADNVIAAAAGVVLDPRNRELLRARAEVVWLRARLDTLADRVASAGDAHRPWLGDDLRESLARLDEGRRELYAEVATEIVDVDGLSPSEVAAEILRRPPRR